jgi:YidC/Oxa1 family membrane protein insertase
MMDLQRMALLGGIFAILFLLLLQWNKFDMASTPTKAAASQQTLSSTTAASLDVSEPAASATTTDIPDVARENVAIVAKASTHSPLISVSTDVLNVTIDLLGGDIVMVSLPTYWAELSTPDVPFELLNRTSEKTYIAQSGLIGKNATDKSGSRPLFSAAQNSYTLQKNEDHLIVDLVLPEQGGIKITKRFSFVRGEHLIDVAYLIDNNSTESWQASFFGQIKRDGSVPKTTTTGLKPFLGVATTTADEHYKKMDFEEVEKNPLKVTVAGGWIAMVQHYFISAWIGNPTETNTFTTRNIKSDGTYILGYTSPTKTIAPGANGEIHSRFYAGPKATRRLEEISPYLDLTVDFGWLWWVAKPIHSVLKYLHGFIGNWGWSIVALTALIKILLFPLSHKAYISMGHMRKVGPKMTAIREQCGDNRQKLQEEMLKLYKTEKINPMGGCLPMLLQMPVFIALYWVLMESVELRHAPFIGWILDLSVMDPWFCLPILMGISMYFQQKMNPAPPDPMQAKVMQFLPVIFTFMFLWFPAGLVLYWLVNNLTSMAHQAYINRLVARGEA